MKQRWSLVVVVAALAVTGCATISEREDSDLEKGAEVAARKSSEGLDDALLAPAEDLNLVRQEIPQILRDLEHPYGPLNGQGCTAIITEVTNLDAVLGADYDVLEEEISHAEEMGEEAADFTLDTVKDASTGFIPFRSLVRRATGASAYEKKVRAAFQRGVIRRSYLKGIGSELGCPPPGSPLPLPPEPEDAK